MRHERASFSCNVIAKPPLLRRDLSGRTADTPETVGDNSWLCQIKKTAAGPVRSNRRFERIEAFERFDGLTAPPPTSSPIPKSIKRPVAAVVRVITSEY